MKNKIKNSIESVQLLFIICMLVICGFVVYYLKSETKVNETKAQVILNTDSILKEIKDRQDKTTAQFETEKAEISVQKKALLGELLDIKTKKQEYYDVSIFQISQHIKACEIKREELKQFGYSNATIYLELAKKSDESNKQLDQIIKSENELIVKLIKEKGQYIKGGK